MTSITRARARSVTVAHLFINLYALFLAGGRYIALCLRPKASVAAEKLFLRKQLALHQERQVKPRRADNITRYILVVLGRWFNWETALKIVQPQTFVHWHLIIPTAFSSMIAIVFSLSSWINPSAIWAYGC